MCFIMEALHVVTGTGDRVSFAGELCHLKDRIAWGSDRCAFRRERRRWNGLQNISSDIRQLSMHLVQELKWALPHTFGAV